MGPAAQPSAGPKSAYPPMRSKAETDEPAKGSGVGQRSGGSKESAKVPPTPMLTLLVVSVSRTFVYVTCASSRSCPGGQLISEGGGKTVSHAVTWPFFPELNVPVAGLPPLSDDDVRTRGDSRLSRPPRIANTGVTHRAAPGTEKRAF